MKLTRVLCKQNLARMIRYQWQVQRKRMIPITKAEDIVSNTGHQVYDPIEIMEPKPEKRIDVKPITQMQPIQNIPEGYLAYENHNVLLEGVQQACLLTKTVKVDEEFPIRMKDVKEIPQHLEKLISTAVSTSVLFDAQQEKLPKLKDPNRPMWVFPRMYGITCTRKTRNLTEKFLHICELLCGSQVIQSRSVLHDGLISVNLNAGDYTLNLKFNMDLMLLSKMHIKPILDANKLNETALPDLYPLHQTVGLKKKLSFENDNFSITEDCPFKNVHTIFLNYDLEQLKNITEIPVTEDQIHAHALMKSFATATICARKKYNTTVNILSEPVVVQCIQTDGQNFHFSIYQLNTLELNDKNGVKNYWWSLPTLKLYENALYKNGKPYIEDYNPEVFQRFCAFYENE